MLRGYVQRMPPRKSEVKIPTENQTFNSSQEWFAVTTL